MEKYANLAPTSEVPQLISCERPHSFFSGTVERYASGRAGLVLHRICNLMRKMGACGEVVEKPGSSDETERVAAAIACAWGVPAVSVDLTRITFLSRNFSEVASLERHLCAEDILGSVLLACWHDGLRSVEHVYEAIVRPPLLLNNYIHAYASFPVRCGEQVLPIQGTYFCQQNGVSGVCAHAALRMLLNTHLGMSQGKLIDPDVNAILHVETPAKLRRMARQGLDTVQIGEVLARYDRTYQATPVGKGGVDYVSFLVSLLESNSPGAVVFDIEGRDEKHIVPVVGHTFNSDLWFHEANYAYHRIGKANHHPHSNWIPSFIVHDDNFGMYYCMAIDSLTAGPSPDRPAAGLDAVYAFGFLGEGIERTGRNAAEMASLFLRTLAHQVDKHLEPAPKNQWLRRLLAACSSETTAPVIRPLVATREQYVAHLGQMLDWEFEALTATDVRRLVTGLPDSFWLCEVSIPDLYTTNKRKIGEVLYAASLTAHPDDCLEGFLACRLPTISILPSEDGLEFHPNALDGHVPLCPTAAIPPREW